MAEERDRLSDYCPTDVEMVVGIELEHAEKYCRNPNPVAVLLAGQPGAGKTVLSAMLNKAMIQTIDVLREKEEKYHLGQTPAIDELERRMQNITCDFQHTFGNMTML